MSQFTATDHPPFTDHPNTDLPSTAGPRPDDESAADETTSDEVVTDPAGAREDIGTREDIVADEHPAPIAALQPAGTAPPAETGGFAPDEDAAPTPTSQPPVGVLAAVMQAEPAPADPAAAAMSTEAGTAHLIDGVELERRWRLVQASFVDEPRQAVDDADALVAETVRTISEALEGKRSGLEAAWNGSGGSDTEHLRVAFRGYRDLFRHLLAV